MSLVGEKVSPLQRADRFFIGGEWVKPSSDAMIDVIDSGTEELFFSVAEAQAPDISRAWLRPAKRLMKGPGRG